jgi:uncharacterized membrane protein
MSTHAVLENREADAPRHYALDWPQRHGRTLWAPSANLVLGAWLLTSPAMLPYESVPLIWSDLASAVLILVFAGFSFSPRHLWAPWGIGVVGLWLLFAPLIFWAPTAAVYANDTLVGTLVITLALIVPGVPGLKEPPGPDTPPGWNYNPSWWVQRAPIIALAFVGFFISRYLAAYQLGHISSVWDPFFPGGTKAVLESKVSRAWPISDAGLGSISYILEALTGYWGGVRRWRTMPWLVVVFGILVVPLGVTSIVLIILQPLAVGAWCTLCLVTAAAMLLMIAPAMDEVVATGQVLVQGRRAGRFWRTFFKGGPSEQLDEPVAVEYPPSVLTGLVRASGLTCIPWNLGLCALLGVWLMFAPTVLGTTAWAADSDHLLGALVVTFSVIAWGEIARTGRLVNIALGAWLAAAPWMLSGATTASRWNDLAVALALMALSVPRGRIRDRFGGWNRYLI